MRIYPLIATSALVVVAGCVSMPTGPSVTALPGSGKSFDQFRADDANCRQYAYQMSGGPNDASADAGIKSAAVGTAVGALAGAALGGSHGAGVGAGAGLLFGSATGASAANQSAYGAQRRYDASYVQCMYANGERVPVNGRLMQGGGSYPAANSGYAPSGGYSTYAPPPPPPGSPPPPPSTY